MDWLRAAEHLRGCREPGVLVTVLEVRGHAPREAGARMVVAGAHQWATIGGGALEATAVQRARQMLAEGDAAPRTLAVPLTPHAPGELTAQYCGGEVVLALEPLPVPPAVAVFGVGHVGGELARILARHDLDLHLVDSRADRLGATPEADRALAGGPGRTLEAALTDPVARVHLHASASPGDTLALLPPGTHVLVMTHEHRLDEALCDAALRRDDLGSIGLIGSSAKWRRIAQELAGLGHGPGDLARIRCPIGLPGLGGKDPATIAVSVAAELLGLIAEHQATAPG